MLKYYLLKVSRFMTSSVNISIIQNTYNYISLYIIYLYYLITDSDGGRGRAVTMEREGWACRDSNAS